MASKTWERWTQKTKSFPEPKYGFTQHLKHIGDYVETYPLSMEDRLKFQHAIKAWAWYHKKRINITSIPAGNGMFIMRGRLVSMHRKRVFVE